MAEVSAARAEAAAAKAEAASSMAEVGRLQQQLQTESAGSSTADLHAAVAAAVQAERESFALREVALRNELRVEIREEIALAEMTVPVPVPMPLPVAPRADVPLLSARRATTFAITEAPLTSSRRRASADTTPPSSARSSAAIPFSTPRGGTPRAEALKDTPRADSPPPSARKCFCCQELEAAAAKRPAGSSPSMERLATSKLRAELQWSAPPIAMLKPSTKFRESPSASLVHRLEGIVWALEQQVTKQTYQIRGMRSHIARLESDLDEAKASERRGQAHERMLAGSLREAEAWVGRLLVKAEEASRLREEMETQLAPKQSKRKGSGKSNYEQQVDAVAAKALAGDTTWAAARRAMDQKQAEAAAATAAAAARLASLTPKDHSDEFARRWDSHVKERRRSRDELAHAVLGSPRASPRGSGSSPRGVVTSPRLARAGAAPGRQAVLV